MKVLTFGEIMLRLKAPGHERFFQSPMLEATFGGGEANVAVSLANYGMDAEFLTRRWCLCGGDSPARRTDTASCAHAAHCSKGFRDNA